MSRHSEEYISSGLVYDTLGTQNCNYDYNVKGCKLSKGQSEKQEWHRFHTVIKPHCLVPGCSLNGLYNNNGS